MTTLALKLVLTPLLIAGATLAGRRYGAAVSGWLVALPLTSGPVAAFLVAEHGAGFGARGAVGSLTGVAAEAAFCLGYAWTAGRGRVTALAVATAGFAAVAAAVQTLPLSTGLPSPLLPLCAGAVLALAVAAALLPRAAASRRAAGPRPRWDLPARAVVATALVVLLTALADPLGARLTGLLAVFPLYAAVLAVFAQRASGPADATAVLRGVVLGLFSFVAFFLALAGLLGRIGSVGAFACATAAALAVHAGSLGLLSRGGERGGLHRHGRAAAAAPPSAPR